MPTSCATFLCATVVACRCRSIVATCCSVLAPGNVLRKTDDYAPIRLLKPADAARINGYLQGVTMRCFKGSASLSVVSARWLRSIERLTSSRFGATVAIKLLVPVWGLPADESVTRP